MKAIIKLDRTVIIEHNDQKLIFSSSLSSKDITENTELFEYLNSYWDTLTDKDRDYIFDLYKDIYNAYGNVFLTKDTTDYITDKVKLLMDMHSLDNMHDWMIFKSSILIPDSFNDNYKHIVDLNTSREKTYTKSDYVKLITLSLSLRCMIPIWGEHICKTRKEKGNLFKEFYAFQLLNKSDIMHSEPMLKLKTYIDHQVGSKKFKPDNTLRCISSDDYIFWLLALVCVRRLCVSDVSGRDPRIHAINFIFKFIKQIDSAEYSFENSFKEKEFEDRGNQENKISVLEKFKIKSNISPGEIVELTYSVKDIYSVAFKLCSLMDINLLNHSVETSSILLDKKVVDPQIILLSWVFQPVISAQGLMYLPKNYIVRCLGVLEAVLWSRGHKYLAILATSYYINPNNEMIISPVERKSRIPDELTERLERIYPFSRETKSKKSSTAKTTSLVMQCIDDLADHISMYSWQPTASDDKLMEVFGNNIRKFPIVPDIKTHLAKLVLELGEKNYI